MSFVQNGFFRPRDVAGAALMAISACVVGLVANALRAQPIPPWEHTPRAARLEAALDRLIAGRAGAEAGAPKFVDLEAVNSVIGAEGVTIFDVRPDLFFEEGHIPGAVNFTRDTLEARYPSLRDGLNRARLVIVYCAGGHCEEAEAMAAALRRLGHGNIAVYGGGWDEWNARGMRMEKETAR